MSRIVGTNCHRVVIVTTCKWTDRCPGLVVTCIQCVALPVTLCIRPPLDQSRDWWPLPCPWRKLMVGYILYLYDITQITWTESTVYVKYGISRRFTELPEWRSYTYWNKRIACLREVRKFTTFHGITRMISVYWLTHGHLSSSCPVWRPRRHFIGIISKLPGSASSSHKTAVLLFAYLHILGQAGYTGTTDNMP